MPLFLCGLHKIANQQDVGCQRANLAQRIILFLILRTTADKRVHGSTYQQRNIELKGNEHTQGKGQSRHLEIGQHNGQQRTDANGTDRLTERVVRMVEAGQL